MKKNIGIITWYKTVNHGAVLQAYALQEWLKSRGYNALELDYNREVRKYNYTFMDRVKTAFKHLNFNKIKIKKNQKKFLNEKNKKFEKFREEYLNIGNLYSDGSNNIDTAIIGSDMVFDFHEGYNPFVYGKNVKAKKIISYAACFGYTTIDSFQGFSQKNEIISLINKMDSISFRDNNTGEILKKCCGVIGTKVIDPVLLYGFTKEKYNWNVHGWNNKRYILIYSYSYNMNSRKEVKNIRRFAKENDLSIISVGYDHPWCDEIVNADPCEFVEIFSNATYVVTDTFHGTIFSLIFNRQFCVTIRDNAFKVLDILDDLNINPNLNLNLYEKLCYLKNNQLNYFEINNLINYYRNISSDYLKKNLES